jgi:hypothetical protein
MYHVSVLLEDKKQHLHLGHPFWLVACLSRAMRSYRLADWNLGQAHILHDGPDNGHATGLRREGIDLISALPHIAKEAESARWYSGWSDA